MEISIPRQMPFFSNLPLAEIKALAANLQERSYPAQTVLFREGERGEGFFVVVEGQIAIF